METAQAFDAGYWEGEERIQGVATVLIISANVTISSHFTVMVYFPLCLSSDTESDDSDDDDQTKRIEQWGGGGGGGVRGELMAIQQTQIESEQEIKRLNSFVSELRSIVINLEQPLSKRTRNSERQYISMMTTALSM